MFETWLMVSTPLKNIRVSWDDDIPNISPQKMDLNHPNAPNHQPETIIQHLDFQPAPGGDL